MSFLTGLFFKFIALFARPAVDTIVEQIKQDVKEHAKDAVASAAQAAMAQVFKDAKDSPTIEAVVDAANNAVAEVTEDLPGTELAVIEAVEKIVPLPPEVLEPFENKVEDIKEVAHTAASLSSLLDHSKR